MIRVRKDLKRNLAIRLSDPASPAMVGARLTGQDSMGIRFAGSG